METTKALLLITVKNFVNFVGQIWLAGGIRAT